jgi:hypothetical protein
MKPTVASLNVDGPTPRATLRIAVGAFVTAVSLAINATWDLPGPMVAGWSGVALATWGIGEAAFDAYRSNKKNTAAVPENPPTP